MDAGQERWRKLRACLLCCLFIIATFNLVIVRSSRTSLTCKAEQAARRVLDSHEWFAGAAMLLWWMDVLALGAPIFIGRHSSKQEMNDIAEGQVSYDTRHRATFNFACRDTFSTLSHSGVPSTSFVTRVPVGNPITPGWNPAQIVSDSSKVSKRSHVAHQKRKPRSPLVSFFY